MSAFAHRFVSAGVEHVGAPGDGALHRSRRTAGARNRCRSTEFGEPPRSRRLSCHRACSQDAQTVQVRRGCHKQCVDSARSETFGPASESRAVGSDKFALSDDFQAIPRGIGHNEVRRIHTGPDDFDAGIDRVGVWTIGARRTCNARTPCSIQANRSQPQWFSIPDGCGRNGCPASRRHGRRPVLGSVCPCRHRLNAPNPRMWVAGSPWVGMEANLNAQALTVQM